MQLTTILSALAAVCTVMAAPADTQGGEPLPMARDQPLLRLYGITGITSTQGTSSFTGRGTPGKCQNFPYNINGFERADAAYGYECDIYTETNCRGSSLTVGTPIPDDNARMRLQPTRPTWQSWVCYPLEDDPFPKGP
jgi:hypothetical protein